jgi:hypothetical protein
MPSRKARAAVRAAAEQAAQPAPQIQDHAFNVFGWSCEFPME